MNRFDDNEFNLFEMFNLSGFIYKMCIDQRYVQVKYVNEQLTDEALKAMGLLPMPDLQQLYPYAEAIADYKNAPESEKKNEQKHYRVSEYTGSEELEEFSRFRVKEGIKRFEHWLEINGYKLGEPEYEDGATYVVERYN